MDPLAKQHLDNQLFKNASLTSNEFGLLVISNHDKFLGCDLLFCLGLFVVWVFLCSDLFVRGSFLFVFGSFCCCGLFMFGSFLLVCLGLYVVVVFLLFVSFLFVCLGLLVCLGLFVVRVLP